MKQCSKCKGQEQPDDQFYVLKSGKLSSWCKTCYCQYQRYLPAGAAEHKREYKKAYYQKHKVSLLKRGRRYRQQPNVKARRRKWQQQYRARRRARMTRYQRRWQSYLVFRARHNKK